MDLFLEMGNVQVTFETLIHCFVQWPSYLLRCTPSSSTFIESLISFDFSLFQMFGCLLGLGSFDNPEGLLTRKQTFFPIIFDGIGFIPMATIAAVAYLWSWVLVASIIAVRFMVI